MSTPATTLAQTFKPALLAAGLALGLFASQAHATPIPVGSGQSADLVYNFNFGQAALPYTAMSLVFTLTGLDAGEVMIYDAFADLNGVGFFAGSGLGGPFSGTGQIGPLANFPQLTDGIFSFGFRLTQGAADISDVYVRATTALGTQTFTGSAVPEPSSLALVGLALAGLTAAQRRRC